MSARWGGWGSHVDADGLPKRRTFYGPDAERKAAGDRRGQPECCPSQTPGRGLDFDPRAEVADLVSSAT